MRRPVQFVALLVMALLACYPLVDNASCVRQSCSGSVCPRACCPEMLQTHGLHQLSRMSEAAHAVTACLSLLAAVPPTASCGQTSTLVMLSRDGTSTLTADTSSPTPLAMAASALLVTAEQPSVA